MTKEKPSKETTAIFESLNSKYERKIDRGAKFKFMWINVEIEKKWGELFKFQDKDKVVILNPGKRKRFAEHDGAINKDAISVTLESISGGDAKFNRMGEIPSLELRPE